MTVTTEPLTKDLKLINNSSNPKKGRRLGVMSITKLENVQLGLILQYLYKNENVVLPESVLQFPDALDKLVSRYST